MTYNSTFNTSVIVETTTTPFTAVNGMRILMDTTAGAKTVALPAVATSVDAEITVVNITGTNTITVDGNASETINGATTYIVGATAYEGVVLKCTGTEWIVITKIIV